MYEIILFTHGNLSTALKDTAEMIMGEIKTLKTFSVQEDTDLGVLESAIDIFVRTNIEKDRKIIVLTDIYFGTPFNITVNLMNIHKILHLTGINLPLLIEIVSLNNQNKLINNLEDILLEGKKSIQIVG